MTRFSAFAIVLAVALLACASASSTTIRGWTTTTMANAIRKSTNEGYISRGSPIRTDRVKCAWDGDGNAPWAQVAHCIGRAQEHTIGCAGPCYSVYRLTFYVYIDYDGGHDGNLTWNGALANCFSDQVAPWPRCPGAAKVHIRAPRSQPIIPAIPRTDIR